MVGKVSIFGDFYPCACYCSCDQKSTIRMITLKIAKIRRRKNKLRYREIERVRWRKKTVNKMEEEKDRDFTVRRQGIVGFLSETM